MVQVSLKAARVNAGLTQKIAAERLKVSEDTIGNWERGKSFPDAINIKNIEKVYGVRYDQLIFLPHNYA